MEPIEVEVLSSADSLRLQNDQYFTHRAALDRDFIYEKLKELADGVWLWYRSPDGSQTRAYKRPPDIRALAILSERAAGKQQPTEDTHRVSEGVTSIQNILKKLHDDNIHKRLSSSAVDSSNGVDNV